MVMSLLLPVPGVVLDAIYPMKYSPPPILVGVRRRLILDPSPVCPHIHVVRHVHGLVEVARIRVIERVTLALVLLVHPWVQLRIASAVGTPPPKDAKIPTMSKDGAVVRSVVICFHVGSTHALFRVMKACVVLARSRSRLVVIVAKCRPKCCAAPRRTRWKAGQSVTMDLKRSGLDALVARKHAIAHSIAVCISAKRTAIHRTRGPPIVLDRQTSWSVVRVEKRHWPASQVSLLVLLAKIQFPTVASHVAKCFHVVIPATKSVILGLAAPVCVGFQFNASVAATPP